MAATTYTRARRDGRAIPNTVSITITEREAIALHSVLQSWGDATFAHVEEVLAMKLDRLERAKAQA